MLNTTNYLMPKESENMEYYWLYLLMPGCLMLTTKACIITKRVSMCSIIEWQVHLNQGSKNSWILFPGLCNKQLPLYWAECRR